MMGGRGGSATYVAQRGQIIHRRCTAARPILIGPHLENNKTLLHELKVDRIKDSGHEISAKHNRTHLHTLARRKRTLNSQIRTNAHSHAGRVGHSRMRRWVQRHRGDESKGCQRREQQSDDHRPAANAEQSSGLIQPPCDSFEWHQESGGVSLGGSR